MGNLFICFMGCSGSGKDTVATLLAHTYDLKQLKSYTSRKKRYPHEDTHTFVTASYINNLKDKVGYTVYNKEVYCATQEQVEHSDIYVIDPHGVTYLLEHYHGDKHIIIIYLKTNILKRIQRMYKRGDKPINIIKRIIYDYKAFKNADMLATYTVDNNNDIDDTLRNIKHIIIQNI